MIRFQVPEPLFTGQCHHLMRSLSATEIVICRAAPVAWFKASSMFTPAKFPEKFFRIFFANQSNLRFRHSTGFAALTYPLTYAKAFDRLTETLNGHSSPGR